MSRGVIAVLVVAIAAAGGLAFATTGDREANEPVAPHFVDDTAASGIDHRYSGEFQFFVGGGVAAFDCDDDGLSDIYLAGGSEPAALYRNESTVAGPLRFTLLESATTDLTNVTGAYPIDIDGDSHLDLAVLRVGEDVVLRGQGDCRFERANERWGIDGGDTWTAAFSATWEATNALPTMAFGDYLAPDHQSCEDSRLLRPDGRTYAAPVALAPGYCTLSILFSDWQRTGRHDLRMSNDRHYYRDGTEQLWRIEPGEAPVAYGEADGWRPLQIWGMGIASQDMTGDGLPEVFLTSQGDNKLQSLVGDGSKPTYEDIALEYGVTATRPYAGGDVLPSTAWHSEFEDVNNDGLIDLFITKGNVDAQVDYARRDPNNLLLGRRDGTLVEAAEDAGIVGFERGRGAALVDLNLDGMLDLVVVNRRENARVWRNVGRGDAQQPEPEGHWIALRLRQPGPNRDAIGSWVEVQVGDRTIEREVTIGGGHAGGKLGWMHAGLGDRDTARVRVQWPDGETGPWMDARADEFVTIERGATEVEPWVPEVQQP